MIKFFDPAREFRSHQSEYVEEYIRVRNAGNLILREELETFEKNFAKYIGVKYAVGVNSGTDALLIALKAIGIKAGDKVLVPSHTFVATPQVVQQLGAIPVLYDLGDGLAIMGDEYKAIIPAHISGNFDMNMMNKDIPVIEDACQALGAELNHKKAGSFGKVGCFSFYPAKILGAPGDAGALVTNDKDVYEFAKDYRNHWKSDYSEWGINSRLDNIWAVELNLKLERIMETLVKREEIAQMYLRKLKGIVGLPEFNLERVWQDFIIKVDERDKLYEYLKKEGIETMKNEYPFPIPKLPKSLEYEAHTLRLPINETLTNQEIYEVINAIKRYFNNESAVRD